MAKAPVRVEVSNLHRTEAFASHRDGRLTVHGRRPRRATADSGACAAFLHRAAAFFATRGIDRIAAA
ncbi:hypothetical protein ACFWIJ_35955 [Streptomyces sp. NPDC127079]|uniref:hypothetical protein n=1 Tax=Streptomyces sp. NPDC127079 TaxID=3347132 RepID=UPI0036590922